MIADEPTVPKLIVAPLTVPFRLSGAGCVESVMVPLRLELACCQLSWKVPVNAPL